nr:uncharacterized protein LOC109988305 [Labrus bergylta]
MCSAESLREFVVERLTAAAEDIFVVFKRTIVEYEEEIDRQRRLLDIDLKPQINFHRTDVPQQHVCKEEEVLVDQQLCNQERNSSPDQDEPEPPQIEEEQEEHCSSQEGEQLVLKETDTSMLTLTHEERDHSEVQLLNEHQPISNSSHDAEDQDPTGSEHINKGLTSAEDKFVVSKNTNVEYEGGIDWKSRLLDIVWKPHIYLNRIDVPQQHVCKERRRFWSTSSSVIRRGTPVQTKRSQSLHRLKRSRRNTAAVRRESSSY